MILRLICLICLAGGYCFGLFQSAFIIGKIIGIDIRKEGSGNLGATNMMRVAGLIPGIITFVLDLAKVFAAIIAAKVIVINVLGLEIDYRALALYTGLGVVLGHIYPFYLHFKGGKGVAATAAIYICMWDWKIVIIGVAAFVICVAVKGFVSLGSLMFTSLCYIAFIIFMFTGLIDVAAAWRADCIIIMGILVALVFYGHRENIQRLASGTEKKFTIKKKE